MSNRPYDVTLKDLLEDHLTSWPAVLGPWPVRKVTLIDADVSTVTAAADKVMRCEGDDDPWLLHLEAQSDHDLGLPGRAHLYATVLHHRHGLLVRSVLLLLRREANASNLTGVYRLQFPDEAGAYLEFRYHVVRVWELPLAPLLAGPVGTLPLAPLTDEAAPNLSAVVDRVDERLRQEVSPPVANKARVAMMILMGLRYPEDVIRPLYERLSAMKDSSTYRMIVAEGLAEGLAKGKLEGKMEGEKEILLRLGSRRFGPPDAETLASLHAVNDLEQVTTLLDRLLDAADWQELLAALA